MVMAKRLGNPEGGLGARRWHERFVTVVGVNAWAPEWYPDSIREFDADALASMVSACGAAVGATFQGFSQDHFGVSFFQTKLGHMHVNLASGRDHIYEYSEALHKRGLRFFAYYCFQDRYLWDRQPDWRQKDASGDDIGHVNFGDLCPNSPYREHVISRMSEISRNYDVDGWLLDMLEYARNPAGCYCSYCRRKYREAYGRELPVGPPEYSSEWLRLVQWRFKCIEDLLREIVTEVKRFRPSCVFTHNAFAFRAGNEWEAGEDFEQLFEYDDVVTNIPTWNFGGLAQSRFVDMIWKAGLYTRVFRGLSGKPVWMQFGRFPYDRDYQCQAEPEIALAAYSIISNGGCPFVIDNVFPSGVLDRTGAARLSRVLSRIKAETDWFEFDGELAFAAVLYSRSSHTWSDLAHPGESRYLRSFEGLCKALSEGHVPYQVVSERRLGTADLSRFKVVVCPESAVLDEEAVSALREYVRGGGGLVAMGRAALADASGTTRDNFALADVLGADFISPLNYTLSYLRPLREHIICDAVDGEVDYVAVRAGNGVRFAPREGSEVVALSVPPATQVVPGSRVFTYSVVDAPPHEHIKEAGMVATSFGKGRAVYAGTDIAGAYGVYGNPELRRLLLSATNWCGGGAPPLEVRAPMCVETSCYLRTNQVLVHLLNYGPMRGRLTPELGGAMVEESVPVAGIELRLRLGRGEPETVHYAGSDDALTYRTDGDAIVIPGVVVDTHCIVVVEFAGEAKSQG